MTAPVTIVGALDAFDNVRNRIEALRLAVH